MFVALLASGTEDRILPDALTYTYEALQDVGYFVPALNPVVTSHGQEISISMSACR
jgi:hypothetical protein